MIGGEDAGDWCKRIGYWCNWEFWQWVCESFCNFGAQSESQHPYHHMEEVIRQGFERLERISADYSRIEDSCVYVHLDSELSKQLESLEMMHRRVDGLICFLFVKGTINVKFNSDEFVIDKPSMLVAPHGSLINLHSDNWREAETYIVAMSSSFVQNINISFSSISITPLQERPTPVLEVKERELPVLLRYFGLMHSVMSDKFNLQLNRHILSNLAAALFYHIMVLVYKRAEVSVAESSAPRRSSYVQDFMRLVHMHFTRERSVNFYASQLFISPKYLSLLVKEATGRSAARWIDHFVITEAKNLLRFSGKNIQQVAYALNFSNQSSFGKYFKHLTGMSPTEFQKS